MSEEKTEPYSNPNYQKEWETARTVLADFDGRLHDLRKIGFTFLTTLLAAESVIFPLRLSGSGSIPAANLKILPDELKVVILAVNFVLIVALQIIDRNYQVFQRAAATRATILERAMNLELSEVISQRYKSDKVQNYVTALYSVFVGVVLFLGVFSLYPSGLTWAVVGLGIGAIVVSGWLMIYSIKVNFPFGSIDWTIDRLECNVGNQVRITLTNLCEDAEIVFKPNIGKDGIPFKPEISGQCIFWKIENKKTKKVLIRDSKDKLKWKDPPTDKKKSFNQGPQDSIMCTLIKEGNTAAKTDPVGKIKEDLTIPPSDSHTWALTANKKGIYRVHRLTLTSQTIVPLFRKLRVNEKPAQKPDKPVRILLEENVSKK